ncbi:MAG: ABC transporter substrate-binding protein [Chitinophagaceae bacterium]
MIAQFFQKKLVLACILIAICVGVFVVRMNNEQPSSLSLPVVAITQIAPHPSLDEIRRGIMDVLKEAGIMDDKILFQNAQGNTATALQIAQKFISMRPKVIVPITTPSAQAAYKLSKEAGIPVIFSAVSDPYAAKLMPPQTVQGNTPVDIAGVSDLSPIKEQLDMIQKILPQAKTIGVLYNAGEANSNALVALFTKDATLRGFTVIPATVMGTNNVTTSLATLIGRVDAVYIPNDNTVISAIDSVLTFTRKHKLPLFTADPESVKKGALACVAYNQYDIGVTTGKMVVDFLKGMPLKDLGLKKPANVEFALNKHTADSLNLSIPNDVRQKVTLHIVDGPRHRAH